jgi:hypothetical protein
MTNSTDNDDDWAELARELARDKPITPIPDDEDTSRHSQPAADDEGFAEGVAGAEENGDEFEDVVEAGAETTDEAGTGDGQPGTGRKRRRRRRRRRKSGGQPVDAAAGAAEDGSEEAETTEAAETEPAEGDFEPATESGYQDEAEGDSDPDVIMGDEETDEDAGGELLRELIANWNVPSWDDVVGGLYRPER